jgi:hypothetical protein
MDTNRRNEIAWLIDVADTKKEKAEAGRSIRITRISEISYCIVEVADQAHKHADRLQRIHEELQKFLGDETPSLEEVHQYVRKLGEQGMTTDE